MDVLVTFLNTVYTLTVIGLLGIVLFVVAKGTAADRDGPTSPSGRTVRR